MNIQTVAIFGGAGFIGTHVAEHFLQHGLARKIYLVDMMPFRRVPYAPLLDQGLESGKVQYLAWDVRSPIPRAILPEPVEMICNFAAVHREPGHKPEEYFETNLRGAENVCNFAAAVDCRRIVFTSSISPYGPSDECRSENSLPVPVTAYGSSKLAAEKIHLGWSTAGPGRKLLIVRPGVVFGPGEGGNVTRLIRSLAKGYFVYVGNRATRKAGGYVKELCSVFEFGLDDQDRRGDPRTLLNFSANPVPTLQEYVEAIGKVLGRNPRNVEIPKFAMLAGAGLIGLATRPLAIKHPFDSVRVRKLWTSTYVDPQRLRDLGYVWKFTLEEAFLDWAKDCPADFLCKDA